MKDWIEKKLIKEIGLERFNHSVGVMNLSIELATMYGCDCNKAKAAGLLHDCAKYRDQIYLLKRVSDFGIILDDTMKQNKELIHGPIGSKVAEFDYDIKDREILDAIYYHTTGREDMSLLDKIIYIADYIEPGRTYPGVDRIREIAFIDLDKSVLLSMDNTLKFLIDTSKMIHIETIKARNFMLKYERND